MTNAIFKRVYQVESYYGEYHISKIESFDDNENQVEDERQVEDGWVREKLSSVFPRRTKTKILAVRQRGRPYLPGLQVSPSSVKSSPPAIS